ALADLMGRKKVIIIGRVCSIISSIIMLMSNCFLGFAIGFIISALSYNLNSGSEEALIYDSLKATSREDKYTKINGRLNLIIEIAQSLAVFIGGALSEKSFSISYTVAILMGIFALGISFMFKEVKIIDKKEKISIKGHFIDSLIILKENKLLRGILIYIPCICTFSTTAYFYGQQLFSDMGVSRFNIAIIFLINGLVSAIGAILSEKIQNCFKESAFYIVPMFMGASILVLGLGDGYLKLFGFLSLGFFTAILYPISSNKINSIIPSEQRATIISVESMMFSLGMIILFPCVGFIGDMIGLNLAFIMIGVVNILYSVLSKIFIKFN
ncbi:MAG: MFS transporter, partial [Clostridium sp.]